LNQDANLIDVDRQARSDLEPQRIVNRVLAFLGCKLKNLQILFLRLLGRVSAVEQVVSDSKLTRWKHLFAVLVLRQRARLANQRIDDVTIVDRHSLLPKQSLHRLNGMILVAHEDLFRTDSYVDFLADQPTGYGVRIGAHLDGAALGDANASHDVIGVESIVWQPLQTSLFFHEALVTIGVGAGDDFFHEVLVVLATGEVTATAKQ
jgi:hypothetical protein